MALITRLSRLLRADAHAVLDQIEDPEAVLRQAVRDMQSEVHAGEQRILASQQDFEHREQLVAQIQQRITRCNEQLDDCFEAKRDDLARSVLRQRLQHQGSLESAGLAVRQQRESLDLTRERLATQRSLLQNAEQKLAVLCRTKPAHQSGPSAYDPSPCVSDEQVELELVREKNQRGAQ